MIQEIGVGRFAIAYENRTPAVGNRFCHFTDTEELLLLISPAGDWTLPRLDAALLAAYGADCRYTGSLDGEPIFLLDTPKPGACLALPGCAYRAAVSLRERAERELRFIGATCLHLVRWYRTHRFCGGCGKPLRPDEQERMLRCDTCGQTCYPVIAPAIIVALTDGDRLLVTHYAGRSYRKAALVAGFVEAGETAEDTVRREVWEETGLRVRDVTYYKSQPWGFGCSLLLGYFAKLDGPDAVTVETRELKDAKWIHHADFQEEDDGVSLTREMMALFRRYGPAVFGQDGRALPL